LPVGRRAAFKILTITREQSGLVIRPAARSASTPPIEFALRLYVRWCAILETLTATDGGRPQRWPVVAGPGLVACCSVGAGAFPLVPAAPQMNTPKMTSATTTIAPSQIPLPRRRGGGSKSGEVCDVS
jgi:hypothetical protein